MRCQQNRKRADNHALSFLRVTTTTAEQGRAYFRAPTAAALSTTSTCLTEDMITPGENQTRCIYKTPWADLEPRTWHRRVSLAVKRVQNDFLPFAREALNMRDEHGEPMDNNAALRVVLEYGAHSESSGGHPLPGCLPEEVIHEIKEAGCAELAAEQRQECWVENMSAGPQKNQSIILDFL